MPSESGHPRGVKSGGGAAVAEPDQLPCPRCESSNTKFCYYNNYNFSQPRHFCKSCRRYWTRGGTLRDIPVGGSTRKSAKRSRHSTAAVFAGPVFYPSETASFVGNVKQGVSFTSLLGGHGPGGLLGFGGFGLGHGYEDVGFGLGRTVWPFGGVGANGVSGCESLMGNTWQLESGGDCYTLPDLAISMLGNAMK